VKDSLVEAPQQELLMNENLGALMLVPRVLRIEGEMYDGKIGVRSKFNKERGSGRVLMFAECVYLPILPR
jgi:hypothetical protein